MFAIASNPSETVYFVNDGQQTLRVDGCSIDGFRLSPGLYRTSIQVTDKLICPVYRSADRFYLGCLIVVREKQPDRRIAILQELDPHMTLADCDPS